MSDPSGPERSPDPLRFTILAGSASTSGPRLGLLTHDARNTLETPHYIADTSRGVIPHITQDTFRRHTDVKGVYVALEDFVEKAPLKTPPIYLQPTTTSPSSTLRTFTALPDTTLSILAPRRLSPIPSPNPNSSSSLAICTSVGFSALSIATYISAAAPSLNPDILVAPADIPHGNPAPSLKRRVKMLDRTASWLTDLQRAKGRVGGDYAVFAAVLPLPVEAQRWYLDSLLDAVTDDGHGDGEGHALPAGLAIYDPSAIPALPQPLTHLPRLCLAPAHSPSQLLHSIALGADLTLAPFLSTATDAGIALTFTFPAPRGASPESKSDSESDSQQQQAEKHPLGTSLWNPTAHALSTAPLQAGCACYTCARHHRAYVHHLLAAGEMLAWTLVQVHNLACLEGFFRGVRGVLGGEGEGGIVDGGEGEGGMEGRVKGRFEEERARFEDWYEVEMPVSEGVRPRGRGYMGLGLGSADGGGRGRGKGKLNGGGKWKGGGLGMGMGMGKGGMRRL
ncbi:tRNA-guanine transglycosylase [Pseudovirgaria hyperparasitica]|uniref:tRNA-guanine transglycosylase n=1 Tax=Pseudovirgaria hyperparasitica TaxID=470096 RepID=A0A6A6VUP5_9PEZI|nr:tRNA-guanine transglycosylase [Pseudovirgaria hyperparasitica]KAF2753953.1 tRNA-guanine transglycosylase [Pseudovirgaria hyperparasitica]